MYPGIIFARSPTCKTIKQSVIMRRAKLTFLFMACALCAAAQPGIQGGWNINNYAYQRAGVEQDRAATSGFNVGMFYRGWLGYFGIIEPTLQFSRKGAMNDNTLLPVNDYKIRLDYVEFSLPLSFRAPIGPDADFTIGGGPFAALLAHSDAVTHYANGDYSRDNYTVGTGSNNDFKPADAGLRFTTGLRFGQVKIGLDYDYGLADIAPQAAEQIHTRALSLNLGIMFW